MDKIAASRKTVQSPKIKKMISKANFTKKIKKMKLFNQNWMKKKFFKYKNQTIHNKYPKQQQLRNKSMQQQYQV